ncbi:hypothetical protein KQH29_01005 [bacterium]|nr:hypothetical protein [bacterium]
MTTPTARLYFASTSLDLRQTDKPDDFPQDIFIEDVCYRKIDPPFFAWLRHRMETAKRSFESARLPKAKWDELRGRFNRLQEWAIEHYGKEVLQAAIREFVPASYSPPTNRRREPFLFPKTGDWRFTEPVTPDAIRKVNAIREAAHAKGWSDERLYQNRGRFRFPLGQDYGLVCFVDWDHELGEITESTIEIIHTRSHDRHALRFYNSDVFPPRIKASDGDL